MSSCICPASDERLYCDSWLRCTPPRRLSVKLQAKLLDFPRCDDYPFAWLSALNHKLVLKIPSSSIGRLEAIASSLILFAGVGAWGVMILHRGFDYDEVLRAHSIWMTSQGLRPYHDFLEIHPPYFSLLAPMAQRFAEPGELLLALRLVAAIGNVLFLVGLVGVAIVGMGVRLLPALLATALLAFHPDVLTFLAEFRIDGWGYALALWTIVWFFRSKVAWRYAGLGVGTGIPILLFCPKLALLPPLILFIERIKQRGCMKRHALAV